MNYKLFNLFGGQYVHILTRSLRGTEVRGNQKFTGPLAVTGFLVDEDDFYIYLGQDEKEVTDAVAKDDIVRLYVPIEELIDQVFGDVEKPPQDDMN